MGSLGRACAVVRQLSIYNALGKALGLVTINMGNCSIEDSGRSLLDIAHAVFGGCSSGGGSHGV